jgi:hypothetical protein
MLSAERAESIKAPACGSIATFPFAVFAPLR